MYSTRKHWYSDNHWGINEFSVKGQTHWPLQMSQLTEKYSFSDDSIRYFCKLLGLKIQHQTVQSHALTFPQVVLVILAPVTCTVFSALNYCNWGFFINCLHVIWSKIIWCSHASTNLISKSCLTCMKWWLNNVFD